MLCWRRKWPPTPVFLPRESHGQRSPWGPKSWTWLSDWTTTTTTELLKRLEGPHWAFRNSSENRAAACGDTEGTTIFYKWTLPAGWEKHHGNSRLRSNGTCQQKQWKQPKCGLSLTASFWLQEPQVHLGIIDLNFQPLQWRKPHEKAGSIDPPHFSQEPYCSLTSSLTAPTPPGPALYSHLHPILNSFPSLHITLGIGGQRTRWKTKAIL